MADPFVAEIRMFPFNFAPRGWATCDGQLMPISQNTALFSLLGTYYGGDGKSTFALPNLQGSSPTHQGQGPGLSIHDLGEQGGSETVTLIESEIPAHSHNVMGRTSLGNRAFPFGDPTDPNVAQIPHSWAGNGTVKQYVTAIAGGNGVTMAPQALAPSGGSLPHTNRQPYLTVNFCIAMQGIFPPRS